MWWQQRLTDEGIEMLIHHQGGVFSRRQLLAGGWTDTYLRRRLRGRRWQAIFPGVYANFTGTVSYSQHILAGLLYAGEDAMWSHHTAAEQNLLIKIDRNRLVHVTVPMRRRVRRQDGLVIHRSAHCSERLDHVVPPRSASPHAVLDIVDLAESLDDAAATVAEACQSRRVTAEAIAAALRTRRGLRFRRDLGPVLEAVAAGSHSLLELRYLRDVERRHRLPAGIRQRRVEDEFTDVAYAGYGLVVELDGRLHLVPTRRWRDMDRDNRSTLRAEATLRYGWTDITSRPCSAAAQVVTVIRRSGRPDEAGPCGPECPVTPRGGKKSSAGDE